MKRCSSTEARNKLGEIIEEAYYTGEVMIVERRNKPLVAIVPLSSAEGDKAPDGLALPIFELGDIKHSLTRDEMYGKEGR